MPSLADLMGKPGYYRIKVIPKQPQTVMRDVLADGTIKIALAAAPEKGKANQELVRFLSEELQKPVSAIRIVSGLTSPLKVVAVSA